MEDSDPFRRLDLSNLHSLCPTLSENWAGFVAEASAVCLEHNGHVNGAEMSLSGDEEGRLELRWKQPEKTAHNSHADLQDAVEHGASGIACGLASMISDQPGLLRSVKGTGFDYWLGEDDDLLFQKKERLEISGILSGSESDIRSRRKRKLEQIERTNRHLPGLVIVVEFSQPVSEVARK